jgi:hypothetical protein
MDVLAWRYVDVPQLRPVAAGLNVATSLLFTCILVTVGVGAVLPGHLVGCLGIGLWQGADATAQRQLRRAVDSHNQRLLERIKRASSSSRAVPAASTAGGEPHG